MNNYNLTSIGLFNCISKKNKKTFYFFTFYCVVLNFNTLMNNHYFIVLVAICYHTIKPNLTSILLFYLPSVFNHVLVLLIATRQCIIKSNLPQILFQIINPLIDNRCLLYCFIAIHYFTLKSNLTSIVLNKFK